MTDRVPALLKRASLCDFGEDETSQWEGVVRRFRGPLTGFFAKRIHDRSAVEDLVQEVFVRLIRRGAGQAIHKVEQYIFQTAANVLRDRGRRQTARPTGAHEPFDEELHPGSDISPERILLGREKVSLISATLKQLPERTRDVFVLRVLEGHKHADVARLLGISTRAAEKHMAKALARLGHVLDGEE